MASTTSLPADFQQSYRERDLYPCNYLHRSVSTYPSALNASQKKLDAASDGLFHETIGSIEVGIRDLATNNGEGQAMSKHNIHSPKALTDWFGIRQSATPSLGSTPYNEIEVDRADPKCRFIYISGVHTRAKLMVTRSMLMEILTFHQVMPDYLDFLFIFGLQGDPRDLRFSSFRQELTLRQDGVKAFSIGSLARSGRQYQLCYNLKGVTCKYQNLSDPTADEYSIRQAAFYHRLDVVNGNSLWIVTKGGSDIQERFKELTGKKARAEDKSFGSPEECFRSSLSTHLLFCHWSTEDWRGYIRWLEYVIELETKIAVLGPTDSSYHKQVYSASAVQRLLEREEMVSESITVLEANVEIMSSLKRFYEKLAQNKNFDIRNCEDDIEVFSNQLDSMMDDFRLQIGRAKALVKLTSDRTELVKQHRLERLNQNMEKEAIVVRIVTIVTLIYLPATFVSTLFSTDIIKYQGQDSPHGSYSAVAMKRWLEVTLPLTFITLLAAYLGNTWAEKRKKIPLRSDEIENSDFEEAVYDQEMKEHIGPRQWGAKAKAIFRRARQHSWKTQSSGSWNLPVALTPASGTAPRVVTS